MFKFIHLSDLHLVAPGEKLFGLNPIEELQHCLTHIASQHGDAAFCIISGDLTHSGDILAYEQVKRALAGFPMHVHLMMGNHDRREVFQTIFGDAPRDADGFVQQSIDTPVGRFILLDTLEPDRPEGMLCDTRLNWLVQQIEDSASDPIFLFMHHPPFIVGLDRMDRIRLQNADRFAEKIAPWRSRIRHLFVGHLHRAIAGSWQGLPFTGVRGTSHQIALDFSVKGHAPVSFETPGYCVGLVDPSDVIVHFVDVHEHPQTPKRQEPAHRLRGL